MAVDGRVVARGEHERKDTTACSLTQVDTPDVVAGRKPAVDHGDGTTVAKLVIVIEDVVGGEVVVEGGVVMCS